MRWWPEATHDRLHVAELHVSRDWDRLDQELVSALGIRRRVLLHGLEEDCRYRMSARNLTYDKLNKLWVDDQPVTSTSWPGSMRPEFGRTQYLDIL